MHTEGSPYTGSYRTRIVHTTRRCASGYARALTLSAVHVVTYERIERDSNPRYAFTYTHFPDRRYIAGVCARYSAQPAQPIAVCAHDSIDIGCARSRIQNVHSAHAIGAVA